MLNFFTFSKDDNGDLRIFDGQQRTVTCMLILAVIAQKIYRNGKVDAANQIHSSYFYKEDALRKIKSQKKLKFDSEDDDDFFYKITEKDFDISKNISTVLNTNKLYGNKKNMAVNIVYINDLLDDFIKDNSNVDLIDLSTSITDKTFLVEFIADTEEIALSMFESLNNTGKSIEKYYVLKNDLVKCLGEDEVKNNWNQIDFNLSDLSTNSFLISVATLFAGKTTSSKLLDNLYKDVDKDSASEMKELLRKLKIASEYFSEICNPSQMEHPDKNVLKKFRSLSDHISLFGMRQHRPIILAMLMKNFDLAEVNSVLDAVLKLTIKNFYFDERKANTIEKKFADLAKNVYNDDIAVNSIIEAISKLFIDDGELKKAILRKNIVQNRKISYILRRTYNYGLKKGELEVSSENNDVEHIMPQNPKANSQWIKWFPEDDVRERYTYSIGNLTLWLDSDNRRVKNAEFSAKAISYKDSALPENKVIAKNSKWTESEIDERSNRMADAIIKALN
ncbi:HNH endonuclease family protein [Companilactobacillus halodurans]|nr:DUF1524 domain-containing protein [Companilactobacillus halodurans]